MSTPTAPTAAPTATHEARVFFSPGEACLDAIVRALGEARRSADACVFTITDDRIAQALAEAHRRGVKVRIITDNDKARDEGSDADALAGLGIPVRKDETEAHMHHKFAVLDGARLLTGSYNWTRSAARNNQENLVLTDDPRLVEAFAREFERLWALFAR
jgi:phosphatidylserine/phosphatidylglycerophosphate/cardiolipin synthase-like enzyme